MKCTNLTCIFAEFQHLQTPVLSKLWSWSTEHSITTERSHTPLPRTSYKWNHTIHTPLWKAPVMSTMFLKLTHDVVWPGVRLFYCRIVFHGMTIPPFVYPLSCYWFFFPHRGVLLILLCSHLHIWANEEVSLYGMVCVTWNFHMANPCSQ